MSSGNTLFKFFPQDNEPPATNFATRDTFAAASGDRLVLDFIGSGGSVDEIAIFSDFWPSNYDGGGIDVVAHYSTDGTDVDVVQFEVSVEVIQDRDDQDAAGQDFGTATDITDTPGDATANFNNVTAPVAISHANCGSPAKGDRMRFRIVRDHDHAANTDDAQLHGIYITET